MNPNTIYEGDALSVLKTFPDESINCVMTSPPYWALRDYGTDVETIWEGDAEFQNCEHEWETSEIAKRNSMIGMNERMQLEKGNVKSKFVKGWERPSRKEFASRDVEMFCPDPCLSTPTHCHNEVVGETGRTQTHLLVQQRHLPYLQTAYKFLLV